MLSRETLLCILSAISMVLTWFSRRAILIPRMLLPSRPPVMTRAWGRIEHPADRLILFSSDPSLIAARGNTINFSKSLWLGFCSSFWPYLGLLIFNSRNWNSLLWLVMLTLLGLGWGNIAPLPPPVTLSETGSQERQGQIESVIWNELTCVYWTKEETEYTQQKYCLHWTIFQY